MSREKTCLVTGATGNVGRQVVEHLRGMGAQVRAAVRDADRDRGKLPDGVDLRRLDFSESTTFRPALQGVHGLFLLRPPAISNVDTTLNAFIGEAERAGVEHAVFLSVAGADKARFIPHAKVEARLRKSTMAWTFLRVGFFAQNLGDAYRRDIQEEDRILLPAGRAGACFVDVRDVGEVAARALVDGILKGESPELVGPAALSFDAVATVLSDVLGRPIRYDACGMVAYLRRLRRHGDSWGQGVVKTALHVGLRFGQGLGDAEPLRQLLGREPRTLRQYVEDHRELWDRR